MRSHRLPGTSQFGRYTITVSGRPWERIDSKSFGGQHQHDKAAKRIQRHQPPRSFAGRLIATFLQGSITACGLKKSTCLP